MTQTRQAAGLNWRFVGDAWESEDRRGRYQVVEYRPGSWTALWFPRDTGCGCGKGAEGGLDYDGFDQAAAAIAAWAASKDA
jgi:hypothetical protein